MGLLYVYIVIILLKRIVLQPNVYRDVTQTVRIVNVGTDNQCASHDRDTKSSTEDANVS